LIAVWGLVPGTTPHTKSELFRITWPADPAAPRAPVAGWGRIDLTPFDIINARDVELIDDKLYIGDGADAPARAVNDLLRNAVFVLAPCCSTGTAVTADFSSVQVGDPALTTQFTDRSTGGSSQATSWAWDFGDGQTATDENPTHTYAAAGAYTVTLVATNSAGPSTPKPQSIVVTGPLTARFTFKQVASPDQTIVFTDASTGAPARWLWNFGDGHTSTEQSPTHSYLRAETYTVTLTAFRPGTSGRSGQSVTIDAARRATPTAPLRPPIAPAKRGTANADVLRGTKGADRLYGLAGGDRLYGYAGNDLLVGGPGRDFLVAGPGNDTVEVRDGQKDTVDCGGGRDSVIADRDDDLTNCENVRRSRTG
jgi:Ca2+-binding RTX toxin-like protein